MSFARQLSQRARSTGVQPISHLMQLALARPELISLAAGFVDQQTLPIGPTSEAMASVLADATRAAAALQYGTNLGLPALRQGVLDRFLAADGGSGKNAPSIDQMLLTAGSNQLLHLVCDTLLDQGDAVICAAPCYFVFLGMLANLGARSVGVPIDAQGMIPEALEEELARRKKAGELDRVKAIYVTSYFDNPSTVSLSLERRARIVEIAKTWSQAAKIYVIEDAAYRDLRYEGPDLPSMRSFDAEGDTVIVAETFSKSFSPGIRVGWGHLPPALVGPVSGLKANIDFGSPSLNQHLMAAVLERELLEPHVANLRRNYRLKLAAMLEAMDQHLGGLDGVEWQVPSGGLYVWLHLPDGVETGPGGTLMDNALAEGVLYVPGEYCYPAEGQPQRKNTIRLSFGVQPIDNIRRGIEALGRAIRRSANDGLTKQAPR